jgi:hypothetical protein
LEKRFADFLDRADDVIRYFKNERFGFSVTYFENNRPRQYYPDFIVVTSAKGGGEVSWIAETKGKIRPNTPLKSQAAAQWCEKMSMTAYGPWEYIFVPQRAFDRAEIVGARSVADLARLLSPEPFAEMVVDP